MEKEEHQRVVKQLESIPVEVYRIRQMSEESTIERRDSCTSMPPLEEIMCDMNVCNKTICECIDDNSMPPLIPISNWAPIQSVNEIITETPSAYVTPPPVSGYRPSPIPMLTPSCSPNYPMGYFMRSHLLNSPPRWPSTSNSLFGSILNH